MPQIGTVLGNCDAKNELGELRPCLVTCVERAPGFVRVICAEGIRVALCCGGAFVRRPSQELWGGTREAGYWAQGFCWLDLRVNLMPHFWCTEVLVSIDFRVVCEYWLWFLGKLIFSCMIIGASRYGELQVSVIFILVFYCPCSRLQDLFYKLKEQMLARPDGFDLGHFSNNKLMLKLGLVKTRRG